jgi:hypothetical protein
MQADLLTNVANGILRHPAYDQAVLYNLDRKLERRRRMGLSNQAISSLRASHAIVFIVLLHHENPTGRIEDGATFHRILELCEARQICGSRSLRTMLAVSQMIGFVERVRSDDDHRVFGYRPTEMLLDEARRIASRSIGCFDRMVPGRAFAHLPYRDKDFLSYFVRTSIRAYVDLRLPIVEYFPVVHDLLMQKGGTSCVAALVQAALRDQSIPSTHQISRDYAFSASQVRNIFDRAAHSGLISISPQGHPSDVQRLVELYKQYYAREIALFAKYTLGLEPYFSNP